MVGSELNFTPGKQGKKRGENGANFFGIFLPRSTI